MHQAAGRARTTAPAAAAGPEVAPPVVHEVLRSPGRPLEARVRREMEPRFGHSFAEVRVHDDARAAESARAVGALAYTVGRDVVFAAGRYAPGSAEGTRLIAHELAHVVQQRGAGGTLQPRLEVGAVDDPAEREAERAARDAAAPVAGTGRAVLRRAGGWSDAPSSGWNQGERAVGGMRRIPVEGLSEGNPDRNPHPSAHEAADQRAVVIIPAGLNLSAPVDVLLHFHGMNIGYRERKTGGTVRDVALDRLEAQIEASGRRMIGVLAQGTTGSRFGGPGGFDSDRYLGNVFDRLVALGAITARPAVQRVAVSAHSGGGGFLSTLLAQSGQPHLPSAMGGVFLYDAINGPIELGVARTWVLARLNADLAALGARTGDPAKLAYLATSLRFRAYYTNTSYLQRHLDLNRAINVWFTQNAAALGGSGSPVFAALRANYQVIPVGHGDHDGIMGQGDKVQDALGSLPPSPPAPPPPAPSGTP